MPAKYCLILPENGSIGRGEKSASEGFTST
jgi:hypothetical protein